MISTYRSTKMLALITGLCLLLVALLAQAKTETHSLIIPGMDEVSVTAALQSVGGEMTHQLKIINVVAAELADAQANGLKTIQGIRSFYQNRRVIWNVGFLWTDVLEELVSINAWVSQQ